MPTMSMFLGSKDIYYFLSLSFSLSPSLPPFFSPPSLSLLFFSFSLSLSLSLSNSLPIFLYFSLSQSLTLIWNASLLFFLGTKDIIGFVTGNKNMFNPRRLGTRDNYSFFVRTRTFCPFFVPVPRNCGQIPSYCVDNTYNVYVPRN